jgi:hypothetical protein
VTASVSGSGAPVSSDEDEQEVDDRDEPTQSARVSYREAASAVDTLMRYFEQTELATAEDIQPLCNVRRRIESLNQSTKKQTSITDYFCSPK